MSKPSLLEQEADFKERLGVDPETPLQDILNEGDYSDMSEYIVEAAEILAEYENE